jgi:hypothetical protein
MKPDTRHDSLDHPVQHAAPGVGMVRQSLEVNCRHRDDSRSERDEPKRPHADRFVGEISVDTEQHADYGARPEPQGNVDDIESCRVVVQCLPCGLSTLSWMQTLSWQEHREPMKATALLAAMCSLDYPQPPSIAAWGHAPRLHWVVKA